MPGFARQHGRRKTVPLAIEGFVQRRDGIEGAMKITDCIWLSFLRWSLLEQV